MSSSDGIAVVDLVSGCVGEEVPVDIVIPIDVAEGADNDDVQIIGETIAADQISHGAWGTGNAGVRLPDAVSSCTLDGATQGGIGDDLSSLSLVSSASRRLARVGAALLQTPEPAAKRQRVDDHHHQAGSEGGYVPASATAAVAAAMAQSAPSAAARTSLGNGQQINWPAETESAQKDDAQHVRSDKRQAGASEAHPPQPRRKSQRRAASAATARMKTHRHARRSPVGPSDPIRALEGEHGTDTGQSAPARSLCPRLQSALSGGARPVLHANCKGNCTFDIQAVSKQLELRTGLVTDVAVSVRNTHAVDCLVPTASASAVAPQAVGSVPPTSSAAGADSAVTSELLALVGSVGHHIRRRADEASEAAGFGGGDGEAVGILPEVLVEVCALARGLPDHLWSLLLCCGSGGAPDGPLQKAWRKMAEHLEASAAAARGCTDCPGDTGWATAMSAISASPSNSNCVPATQLAQSVEPQPLVMAWPTVQPVVLSERLRSAQLGFHTAPRGSDCPTPPPVQKARSSRCNPVPLALPLVTFSHHGAPVSEIGQDPDDRQPSLYVIELFAGSQTVAQAAEEVFRDFNPIVITIDSDASTHPTHCINVLQWDRQYVEYIKALYGITPTDFVVVWASPPCQAYSRLQISGATVAEGRVPSAARIEQNRRQADRAVAWTFMFCEVMQPYAVFIENPGTGELHNRDVLKAGLATLDRIGPGALTDEEQACGEQRWVRYEVDYCQYGCDMRKHTHIWSNRTLARFVPMRCKGLGSSVNPASDCGAVVPSRGRFFRHAGNIVHKGASESAVVPEQLAICLLRSHVKAAAAVMARSTIGPPLTSTLPQLANMYRIKQAQEYSARVEGAKQTLEQLYSQVQAVLVGLETCVGAYAPGSIVAIQPGAEDTTAEWGHYWLGRITSGPKYLTKREAEVEGQQKYELQNAGEIVQEVHYFNFTDAASGVHRTLVLDSPTQVTCAMVFAGGLELEARGDSRFVQSEEQHRMLMNLLRLTRVMKNT